MYNDASAQHEDSNPPFQPFRIFHAVMEKFPLPSGRDGALGGGSIPAATPTQTRLTGI